MVPIFNLCFEAKAIKSFFLAIVPSSLSISTITDDGSSPASLAMSHPASVCPALVSTPPFLAIIGNICPGCAKSDGLAFFLTAAWIVFALSDADIPVVTPLRASIETVKFVSFEVSLPLCFSKDNPRNLHLDSVKVKQISPRPFDAIKFISAALTNCDAITRSPSFSLFSSSIMMTISPFFMDDSISSVELIIFITKFFNIFS